MKIKSITQYADYRRGVGISDRKYCACDDVTAVSGISLWELVPRIKDWYILDEHLGDDTLVTTDYYNESGRLLVSDKVWVSELRDKKNWKEYLVLYHRRDDPDSECGFSVKAPSPEYALETFYGVIFLPLNVLDVARYTVNYCNEKNYGISNLKLQKVLYFIQAYFLIREKVPCFSEEIEAWAFGPVVPEVYEEFERSGSCDIPYIKTYRIFRNRGLFSLERCEFDDSIIPDAVKREINRVVDRLSGYTATDLTEITMRQDPWENAYVPGEQNEITTESILKYFEEGRKNESQIV